MNRRVMMEEYDYQDGFFKTKNSAEDPEYKKLYEDSAQRHEELKSKYLDHVRALNKMYEDKVNEYETMRVNSENIINRDEVITNQSKAIRERDEKWSTLLKRKMTK